MSRKKVKLLAGFMLFTLISAISFIGYELIFYFNQRDFVITESNNEVSSSSQKEIVDLKKNDTSIKQENEITKENELINENHLDRVRATDISLIFSGDVLFTDSFIQLYHRNADKITGILEKDVVEELTCGDITMINQEFPFSTGGIQMVDKQYTFRANPKYVKILRQMGVDIVSLANNHTLDYGVEALLDTISTLDSMQIKHVGAGENLEKAKTTEYINVNEKTIAFLGASRVIPVSSWNAGNNTPGLFTTYDPSILLEEIKKAKANSDFVVVYVHWGIEKKEHPEEYQRDLAKQYIDAGADLIVGSHPHVLQGIEFYKEKPIVYSMGNFVFGNSTFQSMLLKVKVKDNDKIEIKLVPCETKNGFTSKIAQKDKMIQFYNYIESISYYAKINEQGCVVQD